MKKKISKPIFLLFVTLLLVACTSKMGRKELIIGKEYYRQSDYKNAVKKFSEAISKDSSYWKFYAYRGSALQELDKIDRSILDLSHAIKLVEKIDKWYKKIPKERLAAIFTIRGISYHKKKKYEAAIEDFNKALDLNPGYIDAFFRRAVTKEQMNKLLDAIEDYSKAIDNMSTLFSGVSDSDKILVYLHRANAYRKLNKLDYAIADNNHAIEIKGIWNAYYSRGITQSKMENFGKAISDFTKAIKLKPYNPNAYLYRASINLLTNCDLKKVLADYYSIINIKGIDEDTLMVAYNQIAWILATATDDSIRNGEKALSFAKKSIEISRNCRNFDTLAVAYAECGEYGKAEIIHKQVLDKCKLDDPELMSDIEKHLESYKLKKPLREKCPGLKREIDQLHRWQSGDVMDN